MMKISSVTIFSIFVSVELLSAGVRSMGQLGSNGWSADDPVGIDSMDYRIPSWIGYPYATLSRTSGPFSGGAYYSISAQTSYIPNDKNEVTIATDANMPGGYAVSRKYFWKPPFPGAPRPMLTVHKSASAFGHSSGVGTAGFNLGSSTIQSPYAGSDFTAMPNGWSIDSLIEDILINSNMQVVGFQRYHVAATSGSNAMNTYTSATAFFTP